MRGVHLFLEVENKLRGVRQASSNKQDKICFNNHETNFSKYQYWFGQYFKTLCIGPGPIELTCVVAKTWFTGVLGFVLLIFLVLSGTNKKVVEESLDSLTGPCFSILWGPLEPLEFSDYL